MQGRNFVENRRTIVKGEVYFIQCGELCKIGAARDIQSRFSGLQIANPMPITLIHHIKTNDMYTTERLFKARFARVNCKGEWFNLSPEDIAYIKAGRYSRAIMQSLGNTDTWTKLPDIAMA